MTGAHVGRCTFTTPGGRHLQDIFSIEAVSLDGPTRGCDRQVLPSFVRMPQVTEGNDVVSTQMGGNLQGVITRIFWGVPNF